MLATAKTVSHKTQKCLKPHGTSGFRQYGANGNCIKDGVNIDPPYNTGAAFEHYDDNVAHGTWLSLMYLKSALLRDFCYSSPPPCDKRTKLMGNSRKNPQDIEYIIQKLVTRKIKRTCIDMIHGVAGEDGLRDKMMQESVV